MSYEIVGRPLSGGTTTLLASNRDEVRAMEQLAFHAEREFDERVRALGGDPHRPVSETDHLVQALYFERLTVVVWETEGNPVPRGRDFPDWASLQGAKGKIFWIRPAGEE